MTFALAVALAVSFWSSHTPDPAGHPVPVAPGHGVMTPCHPQNVPVSYRTMDGWGNEGAIMAAFAWPVACDVYITPHGRTERLQDPAGYCADVTHEVGNIDGVPETDDAGWVTSITATDASVPRRCWHWRDWAHRYRHKVTGAAQPPRPVAPVAHQSLSGSRPVTRWT
jgi:hypothetical protein